MLAPENLTFNNNDKGLLLFFWSLYPKPTQLLDADREYGQLDRLGHDVGARNLDM